MIKAMIMPNQDPLKERACRSRRCAPAASDWLSGGGSSHPLHVFKRVCNLANAQDQVLSLVLSPAEMSPLTLEIECATHVDDLTMHIQADSPVDIDGDILRVGALALRIFPLEPWPATPAWQATRATVLDWADLLGAIEAQLLSNHSPEGFAVLLSPPGDQQRSIWQQHALAPVERLLDGIAAHDLHRISEGAGDLAGLGTGLTPSGDDFLIGVMFALWSTLEPEHASSLSAALFSATSGRTNIISTNYLERAAMGEASQAWHDLILALSQQDAAGLTAPVQSLIQLGHSSGQDALTGFLLGTARAVNTS